MSETSIQIPVGTRVDVRQYGLGTVEGHTDASDLSVIVRMDTGILRQFRPDELELLLT